MKKCSERCKLCTLAVVRWERKISPRHSPLRRRESALAVVRQSQKFSPAADPLPGAQDGQNLISLEMVTAFTYRPSLVKIDAHNFELSWLQTHTHTNTATNPQTGLITIHCAAMLSVQCKHKKETTIDW